MPTEEPKPPDAIIFAGSIGTDRVFLCRAPHRRFRVVWHTWSNGSWETEVHPHDTMSVALMELLTWLRCNVETL